MSEWKAKRFWSEAQIVDADGGFAVHLDARPVRTPAKTPLIVPTRELAHAIAKEWNAQEEQIDPLSMPCTRSANAALDKVATQRAEVIDLIAAYGDSDLTCYRAEGPDELVAHQAAAWDPVLEWAAEKLGSRLTPVTGVIHAPQDPQQLSQLHAEVAALNNFELTAFHDLVSLSGSLILGFAACRGHQSPDLIWDTSRIDEEWQIAQWGRDEEADAHSAIKRTAFIHAHRFFMLSADDPNN